jgi:hypothetical protein
VPAHVSDALPSTYQWVIGTSKGRDSETMIEGPRSCILQSGRHQHPLIGVRPAVIRTYEQVVNTYPV